MNMIVSRLLYSLLGVGIGVVGTGLYAGSLPQQSCELNENSALPERVDESCRADLQKARERLAGLEKEQAQDRLLDGASPDRRHNGSVVEPGVHSSSAESQPTEALRWRVSAIEKFIPLSDDQRQRLRAKFEAEESTDGQAIQTESLEDIVGQESALFYRQQVQTAFQKVADEEVEREVVWMGRKLGLNGDQEQAMQQTFGEIEQQIDVEAQAAGTVSRSPQDRVKALIVDNQKRAVLRNERLKGILTPQQYELYAKSQAESAAAGIEVFHDPQ